MEVVVSDEVISYLKNLDSKTQRICRKNLEKLENPYPGRGPGDKEKLIFDGEEIYRLHIGRSFTAFYVIKEKQVYVIEIMTIEKAHKKYEY